MAKPTKPTTIKATPKPVKPNAANPAKATAPAPAKRSTTKSTQPDHRVSVEDLRPRRVPADQFGGNPAQIGNTSLANHHARHRPATSSARTLVSGQDSADGVVKSSQKPHVDVADPKKRVTANPALQNQNANRGK
jgi:hypothetical protein